MTTFITTGITNLIFDVRDVLSTGVKWMLVGNRVDFDLTQSAIRSLFPSLFPVRRASKYRPHGSEPGNIHVSS